MEKSFTLYEAIEVLMITEPFYGHLMINIDKQWNEHIPTACVALNGINISLHINQEFWHKLSNKQKVGIIKHEMGHVCFFHLFRDSAYFSDAELYNIAADICINQYIGEDNLPANALFPSTFPEIPLEEFKDTKYYYDQLAQSGDKKLQSLLDHLKGNKPAVCSHPLWDGDESSMSEEMKEIAKKQVEHNIKEVFENSLSRDYGNIPGHIKEMIEKIYRKPPPVVDWKHVIRLFASESQKTLIKSSRRKYNIRFPDNPATKIKPKKNMLCAIDTSGSVRSKELKAFFGQIALIKKAGTDVDICECDTSIGQVYAFDENKEINVTGRGGTCFNPPMELLHKSRKYNSMIYFTDGGAPYPTQLPTKKVLWVITSNGVKDFNPPRSTVVYMKAEHEEI